MTSEEKYFAGDELALHAWQSKYRLGNESLDEFFERIAREFVRLDNFKHATNVELSGQQFEALSEYGKSRIGIDRYTQFLELFKDFKYIIPGGSVLAGIGSNKPVSLSNCFVIPTDDSIEDIFSSATDMSQIYKRRGGVGVDLSTLRPAKAKVNNAANTTGGVVPFMELYSQVTNTIGQEGRRGALMLSIDINHPDSPEFITIKQNLTKVTGANVSVRLNGEFMKAVENDEDYWLHWPTNYDISPFIARENEPYNELIEHGFHHADGSMDVVYIKRIKAKELWESIIHCAWSTAEPGILFWDNILDMDPASVYPQFKAVSTNPCGEIPLSPYDSCRLIASNLYSIVEGPFTEDSFINLDKAYQLFYEAQIIGDILVDLELEAVNRIIDITTGREKDLWIKIFEIGKNGRRTGVGLTGLADMLAAHGRTYVDTTYIESIMKLKMKAELDASIDLAIINGTFPAYDFSLEYGHGTGDPNIIDEYFGRNTFYDNLIFNFPDQWKRMLKWGRRNISWSTINGGLTQ